MGCNFYSVKTESYQCDKCSAIHEGERYHIGKSSGGWAFTLHVSPSDNIYNYEDVMKIVDNSLYILDEYDRVITKEALIDTMLNRTWKNGELMRHETSDCIGKYNTVDYIIGEFS
jgi:hypothetical protein